MNRYVKISAALAAFALLLVVMGLSTQPQTVEAQMKTVTSISSAIHICTDSACEVYVPGTTTADPSNVNHDNVFTLSFTGEDTVIIRNLDLPVVNQKLDTVQVNNDNDPDNDEPPVIFDGPDANPKTITLIGDAATIVAVHKSSGLTDERFDDPNDEDDDGNYTYDANGDTYQVKAFNGNRIQITHRPAGGQFATIKTVMVDNVKPALLVSSPATTLIVRQNVDLTFSADISDGGSGYTTKVGTTGTSDIDDLDSGPSSLVTRAPGANGTVKGGIRLVVAGNNVALSAGDFTKIDGGWRVNKTINSSAIQNISANIPWYFETKDRAGNKRRTTGSIPGKTSGPQSDVTAATTLTHSKFDGALNPSSFAESNIRVHE